MGVGFDIAVKRDGQYQAHGGDKGTEKTGSDAFDGNSDSFSGE